MRTSYVLNNLSVKTSATPAFFQVPLVEIYLFYFYFISEREFGPFSKNNSSNPTTYRFLIGGTYLAPQSWDIGKFPQ